MSATETAENNAVQTNNTEGGEQVAEGDQQAAQQPPRPGGWAIFKTLLIRMLFIYMISSWFRKPAVPPTDPSQAGKGQAVPSMNLYQKETVMDLYVYISESEKFNDFDNPNALFWLEEDLVYGDWTGGPFGDGSYVKSGQIPISERVQNNGSIYMHVYIVRSGKSPNPADIETYEPQYTIYKSRKLNKMKKRKYHTMKNLITGKSEAHPDLVRDANETAFEILSHWHPNLTLNLVDDHTPWVKGAVPSPLDEYIEFVEGTNYYYPILYFNDYWNLNQDFKPINETTKVLNLTLTYHPLSLFRWQMYAAQSMRNRWYSMFGDNFMEESDEDQDSLKQALTDTNPYLLGLTVAVSIVHSVFEFLAFKNDIQFWRNRKSLEGLSVRSVFFGVFQSVIVLLYVMDNETNFVVRVSVFIGLGIEIWKINKVTDVKFDRENKVLGIFPRIRFVDKETYTESMTKKYDMLAFKYLSWLLFPLLACYCVYSLLYGEHKGWYSWVLSLLYGFLLTFGFIMMTPQLFINYKLKSVAHLPWRMLTYKALNTFIDDLFAFVIKMPILYRIGCFRDDIVFLIYLYQRYIYPVDRKRVNEFGISAEMEELAQNGTTTVLGADPLLEGTEPITEGDKPNTEGDEPNTEGDEPNTEGDEPDTESDELVTKTESEQDPEPEPKPAEDKKKD